MSGKSGSLNFMEPQGSVQAVNGYLNLYYKEACGHIYGPEKEWPVLVQQDCGWTPGEEKMSLPETEPNIRRQSSPWRIHDANFITPNPAKRRRAVA
jgi:hypothetical protein